MEKGKSSNHGQTKKANKNGLTKGAQTRKRILSNVRLGRKCFGQLKFPHNFICLQNYIAMGPVG